MLCINESIAPIFNKQTFTESDGFNVYDRKNHKNNRHKKKHSDA